MLCKSPKTRKTMDNLFLSLCDKNDPNCPHQNKRASIGVSFLFCQRQNGENQRKIVNPKKRSRYVKQIAQGKRNDRQSAFVAMRQERSQLSPPKAQKPRFSPRFLLFLNISKAAVLFSLHDHCLFCIVRTHPFFIFVPNFVPTARSIRKGEVYTSPSLFHACEVA